MTWTGNVTAAAVRGAGTVEGLGEPRSVAEAVDRLTEVTRSVDRRLRLRSWWFAVMLAAVLAVGVVNGVWRAQETARLHRLVDRDCAAFRSAGMIPLPKGASPVAHTFVDSFREAYRGRCTQFGPLPPAPTTTPSPTPTR